MSTNLLQRFAATTDRPDYQWVCRNSTSGRGLRLHQVHPDWIYVAPEMRTFSEAFNTPEEAIEAYLSDFRKESSS